MYKEQIFSSKHIYKPSYIHTPTIPNPKRQVTRHSDQRQSGPGALWHRPRRSANPWRMLDASMGPWAAFGSGLVCLNIGYPGPTRTPKFHQNLVISQFPSCFFWEAPIFGVDFFLSPRNYVDMSERWAGWKENFSTLMSHIHMYIYI